MRDARYGGRVLRRSPGYAGSAARFLASPDLYAAFTRVADAVRRGGTVTVRTPEFEAVHRELAERRILCDFRPDAGIRLGPHFYNTDDELRSTASQIAEIVESGAFERHLGATARF